MSSEVAYSLSLESRTKHREALPAVAVGSTLVVKPALVHTLMRIPHYKSEELMGLLSHIAMDEGSLSELDSLFEEDAVRNQPSALSRTIEAAAYADRFFRQAIIGASANPLINNRIFSQFFFINSEPYVVLSIALSNLGSTEIVIASNMINRGGIPSYDGGELHGLGQRGGKVFLETHNHLKMEPLELRIAAIVDHAQRQAAFNFRTDPSRLTLGLRQDNEFPEGRLFIILPTN